MKKAGMLLFFNGNGERVKKGREGKCGKGLRGEGGVERVGMVLLCGDICSNNKVV
ncbi:hypothetical protein MHB42_19175 [Lysinibacillus sp. FSL K6-0232]|uniref:hypothetical protein n=1 Tax=unclassified Lysinibacillus TaxID=2636778 RepID=UPI0030FC1B92